MLSVASLDRSEAYAIWLQARSAVTNATYPTRIDYTIAVNGLDGVQPATDHYRASCDPSGGAIRVFPISDEALAQPAPVPRGFNFSVTIGFYGGGFVIPVGRPESSPDLIGVPLLAPTYMFGLRYRSHASSGSDEMPTLPVIATVSSQSPDYRVVLADTPTLDGIATYHLELTPLRRPKDNRLRELWVGTNDYLPRKAVVSGNFTIRPLVDVPWTVDFSIIDGAPYIARESAAATLYMEHRRVVRRATIAFDDIREPSGSPYDEPLVEPQVDGALVEPRG